MTGVELSERDHAVLALVDQTRVITAQQIEQALFPPGAGGELSAARRCRRVLARLHDQRFLNRLERRVGGVRSGSSGFVYSISGRGRKALGTTGRARRFDPSDRFLAHALAVSQLHADLLDAERRKVISGLAVEHEPATWRRFTTASGPEILKPDLLVEVTTADGWELRWFVEVDRATEHPPAVIRKCEAYDRYWRSGREAARHEVFPRVLWSVPDPPRADVVRTAIGRSRNLTQELFATTTAETALGVLTTSPTD